MLGVGGELGSGANREIDVVESRSLGWVSGQKYPREGLVLGFAWQLVWAHTKDLRYDSKDSREMLKVSSPLLWALRQPPEDEVDDLLAPQKLGFFSVGEGYDVVQ